MIEPGDPHQAGVSVIAIVVMTCLLHMPGLFDRLQMVGRVFLLESFNRVVDRSAVADRTAAEVRLQRLLKAVVDLEPRPFQSLVGFCGSGQWLGTNLHALRTSCV